MNISEILKLKTKGSNNFDFVDAKLDDDVPLFVDPINQKVIWARNHIR